MHNERNSRAFCEHAGPHVFTLAVALNVYAGRDGISSAMPGGAYDSGVVSSVIPRYMLHARSHIPACTVHVFVLPPPPLHGWSWRAGGLRSNTRTRSHHPGKHPQEKNISDTAFVVLRGSCISSSSALLLRPRGAERAPDTVTCLVKYTSLVAL